MNLGHNLSSKTIINHFDKYGKLKYERILEKDKTTNKNTIDVEIKSASGLIIDRFSMPMKSFVLQYIQLLNRYWNNSHSTNLKDMTGTNRGSVQQINMANGGVNGLCGIRLSTGDTGAIGLSDYNMTNIVAPGNSAGQLAHSSHYIFPTAKADGINYMTKHQRTFTNNTANPINIVSCGFVLYVNTYGFLLARDIIDKNGANIVISLATGQSATFIYNFWYDLSDGWMLPFAKMWYNSMVNANVNGTGQVSNQDIDGDSVPVNFYDNNITGVPTIASGVGTTYGIRVGTGSTLITADDYTVEGKIAHGVGAGQLNHAETVGTATVSVIGNTASTSFSRVFTNNSGGAITIGNYGLVSRNFSGYIGDENRRMLIIKKLTGSILLNNGESVSIAHNIELTV